MIHTNPDIENIVQSAMDCARDNKHEYVTLEHLLKAIISYKPFYEILSSLGIDSEGMIADVDGYIKKQTHLIIKNTVEGVDSVPRKTHALERVFNRAFTQVLFSNRSHVQIIDLYLSLSHQYQAGRLRWS